MTIETINKRIEGKRKEIAKLEAKLGRIEKAAATNWEVNPYYYSENDLKWAKKDLETAKEVLAKYEAELVAATEKANSRNVKAIIEFLENWKARVSAHYAKGLREYYDTMANLKALANKTKDFRWGTPEYNEADKAYKDAWEALYQKTHGYYEETGEIDRWKSKIKRKVRDGELEYISPYNNQKTFEEAIERLEYDLKKDAEAKYDDIIERTNYIVGKITDASYLTIGAKGELNGFIIGERGKAKVETIGAGGYNIQCFHFRTLIHSMK